MSRFFPLLTSVSLLALSVPLAAQSPTTLDPVQVTGSRPAGSLSAPAAAQAREDLEKNAGSVGWVDGESWKARYANNLADIFVNQPGVMIRTRYGQELRASIRGSGLARGFHLRGLELLQDGIPVNMADGSGDFYQIDPLALRYVEVYKGGNALAYGGSTLGGAINFVTPTAHTAIAPHILRAEAGSFGTWRGAGQISRVLGNTDFLLNATVSHQAGYREHQRQEYEQFNGNLGIKLAANIESRFYLGAYVTAQKLPGALTLQQALNAPRKATAAAVSGDQARDVWVQRLANRTSIGLENGQIDLTFWAIHKKLFHPIFQVIDQEGWTYGFAPKYTTEFKLGGLRDEFIVGLRAFAGDNDARQYINVAGSRGAQTLNSFQQAKNYQLFAENRLFVLPELGLVTGFKAFSDNRHYTDYGAANKAGDKTYTGLSPKLGLIWTPAAQTQVFANISRSVDVPDFSDLNQTQTGGVTGFVPLRAQHGWTAELGTRGRRERFGWDATGYYAWVRDELLQYTTGPGIPASTFNAPRTIHAGIEFTGHADLARNLLSGGDVLTFRQTWTWSEVQFDGDAQYRRNRVAGSIQHQLRSELSYTGPHGITLTPTLDWIPQGAWVDHANTQRAPGYTLLGLQASWAVKDGLLLFLDARNLTDKRYIADLGTITDARRVATAVYYPGEGRSVFGGARLSF